MPKKAKIGKDRRDKFYKLAKETGFRSRAAFKLIQLNRRFGFLQTSQVCIDLCAAPGGWMQVAKQTMPISSIVIGVDLFPIKPVPGCLSIVEDITTDKCKAALIKELKTWKADVILNDGAPNVGRNWLYDAYQQICLSLGAVKLSTEFLRPGGWFVTKVFRSKDYNAFIWVLKQLFKKVYATKPSASRKESAEIFVVCQGYKAPDKIDPKFLDPKYVFEELDIEPKNKIDLMKEPKKGKKEKAEGYEGIDVRKVYKSSEFFAADSALDVLQLATEIRIDDEKVLKHRATTSELLECIKDIKVLGRKELKEIIKWWKLVKQDLYTTAPEEEPEPAPAKVLTPEEVEEKEIADIDEYIAGLKAEEQKDDKRKKRKANKERSKLDQKLSMKMVIKGDSGPQEVCDEQIFNLREIKNKKEMNTLLDVAPDLDGKKKQGKSNGVAKSKYMIVDENEMNDEEQHAPVMDSDDEGELSEEIEEGLGNLDSDEESDGDNWHLRKKEKGERESKPMKRNRNPLITDLDYRDKEQKRVHKAEMWFEKDAFKDMNEVAEKDEDLDLDRLVKTYKKKGVTVLGEVQPEKRKEIKNDVDTSNMGMKSKRRAKYAKDKEESSDDDSGDDIPSANEESADEKEDFEVVPRVKRIKLTEQELAIGQMIGTSRKVKRDLLDAAWNRYMFNDENLPDWFIQDEEKANKKDLPVPDDMIQTYRRNLDEFNTRSIKKVMEAKARKKRQSTKAMEKIKKKAENILENAENSAQEKTRMLKKMYKKTEKVKQNVTYVVAKKTGIAGKKVRRPAGVEGRFKVVDPRLKKDMRSEQAAQKKQRGRKNIRNQKASKTNMNKMKSGKAGKKNKRK